MRGLTAILLLIALTAAVGYAVCSAMGWDPHRRELCFAAGACIVASIAGFIPLVLTRGAKQDAVTQGALVGTMVHMFACVAAAAVVLLQKLGKDSSFIYWLLSFYGVSLTGIVACYVRAIRKAPPTESSVRK